MKKVVGPKGKHDPERTARRYGHEHGSMTLGGRGSARPTTHGRCRSRRTSPSPIVTPLTRAVIDRMLTGVSTRRFARVGEPVGTDVDEIPACTHVVALGITTDGVKSPLGLWEGSTENATLARTMLADLVDRGLDAEQAMQFVIDGWKALRRALIGVFGEHALVHRCHRHNECNVCDLLPERDLDQVRARMRTAWSFTDPELARQRLLRTAPPVFERGWRWLTSIQPIAKNKSCEASHFQYHVSGVLKVVLDDGTESECRPGDVSLLPSGHDTWVIGGENYTHRWEAGRLDRLGRQVRSRADLLLLTMTNPDKTLGKIR